jgi:hypothetical protein
MFPQQPQYDDQDPRALKAAWAQDDQYAAGLTGDIVNLFRLLWIGFRWPLRRVASIVRWARHSRG